MNVYGLEDNVVHRVIDLRMTDYIKSPGFDKVIYPVVEMMIPAPLH